MTKAAQTYGPADISEDVENLRTLVERAGGKAEATNIAGMQAKRLEAALGGDLSKINALHLSRLEAHVKEAVVSGPASWRVRSRKREAMSTPTLREVRIGASAARLAGAKWRHAATCLPEAPSPRQLNELMAAEIEAQAASMQAEDLRAVYEERHRDEPG
jgi:hypothetical protein